MARVLVRLPQVLVIRLNRALPNERRVDCSIEFDEELDVSERLLQPELRPGHTAIDSPEATVRARIVCMVSYSTKVALSVLATTSLTCGDQHTAELAKVAGRW